jgi:hypothetical protein
MLAFGVLCLALGFWGKMYFMQKEIDLLRVELDHLKARVAQGW